MNCDKINTILIEFLQNELSVKDKAQVEQHLKGCPKCQQERELLLGSWQMLDDYKIPKLKDDFTASLMRKIHAEQARIFDVRYGTPRFGFGPFARRLAPVFATLIIVMVTFVMLWRRPSSNQDIAHVPEQKIHKQLAAIPDEEIIKDLDIFEDIELFENFELVSELDVVEKIEDSTS